MITFFGISNNIDVSIVIPVYNGSHLLERHVTPFMQYLKNLPFVVEIVLVDDGSDDMDLTKKYAEKYGLTFLCIDSNKGKGNALRTGFSKAKGEIQLFTDVDIPFMYSNIDEFVTLLRKYPNVLIVGDRTHNSSIYFEKSSIIRNIGSNVISKIVSRFFIPGMKDTQCGLKGMSRSSAELLFSTSVINRFAIDIELIYLARKFNIPVKQLPVQLRCNDESSVKVIRDGIRLLYDILKIKWNHRGIKTIYRPGDRIFIEGGYQYRAFNFGKSPQRYWHKFKFDCALNNLDINNARRVLDVGCGSGILSSIIARGNANVQVVGLDGNADAIVFCKRQWRDLKNLSFYERKVEELYGFNDGSVDRIVFLEVIEHITKSQASHVLTEFHHVLKNEGILVISTPNKRSLWPIIEFVLDWFKLVPTMKNEQHEVLYSGKELRVLAERSGFNLLKKQTINFIAPWVSLISKKLAEKIHRWESERLWLPGSILVYTFIKKNNS